MTAPTTAEEWGRLAVSLPGWRWMAGMAVNSGNDQGVATVVWTSDDSPDDVFVQYDEECPAINIVEAGDNWSRPDPDDPATAGCLMALLGDTFADVTFCGDSYMVQIVVDGRILPAQPSAERTIGRACIRVAATLGRWPGGKR